jgi:hypothetical protein
MEAFIDFIASELLATEVRWDAGLTEGANIEAGEESWVAALKKA